MLSYYIIACISLSSVFRNFFRIFFGIFFRFPKDILAFAFLRDSFDIISYSDLFVKHFSRFFSDFFRKVFRFSFEPFLPRASHRGSLRIISYLNEIVKRFSQLFFGFFSESFPKQLSESVAHPLIGDSLHTLPHLKKEVNCFYAFFCFFSRFFSGNFPYVFHPQDVVFLCAMCYNGDVID